MKKIGVLTSGGDAPGMNAAIRSVVRNAVCSGAEVIGVCHGYQGLIEGDAAPLFIKDVSETIHRGGTVLHTSRSPEFMTPEGIDKAVAFIKGSGMDSLVVIGGDGSFRGCIELAARGIQVIGIPGTIDNDIFGTDLTIGFDTAVNTAAEAIGRIRDTASSHERVFVIEVMGRESGWIALDSGIAGGADAILIPEFPFSYVSLAASVKAGMERGKIHTIIVTAEGAALAKDVSRGLLGEEIEKTRITVLGHLQRGGTPSALDRVVASRMGEAAVRWILDGKTGLMTGASGRDIKETGLSDAVRRKKRITSREHNLASVLSI